MNPTNERSNKEELPRSRHFGILLFKTTNAAVDYMGATVSRTQCVLDPSPPAAAACCKPHSKISFNLLN